VKYVLAVSGGVDSVALLDLMTKTTHHLIVAHVDHGIRGDSTADARFVEALAKKYSLPFVSRRFELGKQASEEQARDARYGFLFEVAKEHRATLMTAHHRDDAVETIALNLTRGTGWRGLAVLDREQVRRPLLGMSKPQLYDYALKHRLEWVEDSTNATDTYLRNRLRSKLNQMVDDTVRTKLMQLRSQQLILKNDIDREALRLSSHAHTRHFLNQIDHMSAMTLLGAMILHETGTRPPRPQLERALLAVKTARAGSIHHVGARVQLRFTSRNISVEVV